MPRRKGNQRPVEFIGEEVTLAPQMNEEGRDARTGRPIGDVQLPGAIADMFRPYSDKYHEYHSTSRPGTKINPLWDIRLDPESRFVAYLQSDWNEFGDDIQAAAQHAASVFQEQGENIAGRWRKRYEQVQGGNQP